MQSLEGKTKEYRDIVLQAFNFNFHALYMHIKMFHGR